MSVPCRCVTKIQKYFPNVHRTNDSDLQRRRIYSLETQNKLNSFKIWIFKEFNFATKFWIHQQKNCILKAIWKFTFWSNEFALYFARVDLKKNHYFELSLFYEDIHFYWKNKNIKSPVRTRCNPVDSMGERWLEFKSNQTDKIWWSQQKKAFAFHFTIYLRKMYEDFLQKAVAKNNLNRHYEQR